MAPVFSILHESLQHVLNQRLGWNELREVQERSYKAITEGSDVLVLAPTAGGKSEAALIPVMDDILKHGRTGITCLYISPLKALINDQEERFSAFCVPTGVTLQKWHGDVPKGDRRWKDGEPPHILMITPESLEVLLQEKEICPDLHNIRYVIIDELHAFVESERGVHLKILLDRLDRITLYPIQRIGLSATAGNPVEILKWLSDMRRDNKVVEMVSPPKKNEFLFVVEEDEEKQVDALVRIVAGRKALVFVNSRSIAERIMKSACGRILNLHIHHSSLSTALRKTAEDAFHRDDGACIICTSTLELGIDIGDLDVVVQIGPPGSVSSFLQRMGRTGRRGGSAFVAWILANPGDLLCSCAIMECAINKEVEHLQPLLKPYNVFLQQLFLLLFHASRISRKRLVRELRAHPAFSALPLAGCEEIVSHLVVEGYLAPDGDMVMPGIEAERVFGRSNWKDLYSVISGSGEYRAVTPDGDFVGKLDARFVNSPDSGEFSLGGQSWSMVKCDEQHNLVVVVPHASEKSRVFWSGGGEQGYSSLVCNAVQRIIARQDTLLPLGKEEKLSLKHALAPYPEGVGERGIYVCQEHGRRGTMVVVYSFYGSPFNRVLGSLIRKIIGGHVQVRYDDFRIFVMRAGKEDGLQIVANAIQKIPALSRTEIGSALSLPSHENWKFARALPATAFKDMILSDYFHIESFQDVIGRVPVTVLGEPDAIKGPRAPDNNNIPTEVLFPDPYSYSNTEDT
ncbi:MAG: DEAD/DEAH box helicase [Methanoregula sp.]